MVRQIKNKDERKMRFFSDTAKYAGYVVRAAKSQLKAEVANSYLNWVWWILDPLCFMLIYAFIFGVVFDGREPYFAAFIFVGLTAWNFFNKCSISSVKMVKRNKAIIDKVYIPKYVLAYTRMGVDGFKMMISFAIIVCMMAVYRVHLTWNVVLVLPILALLLIITFAAMTILMHLGVFVEDMSNIVTILFRLLFYVTGIFYSVYKRLPAPYGEWALRLNPMAFILDGLRKCLLYGETPDMRIFAVWMVIGLLVAALGVKIIYRYENGYAKVV